jgi:hypothetical protein
MFFQMKGKCWSKNTSPGWPDWANLRPLGIKKYISSPHYWATYFHGNWYAFVFTKYGLGHILGDFLQNWSGHPTRHSSSSKARTRFYGSGIYNYKSPALYAIG